MTDSIASTMAKPRSRKKRAVDSSSLPHEIDSAGRTRAATRILVKLPTSTNFAPAIMNDTTRGAEIPELGVESETSEADYLSPQELISRSNLLANAARRATAFEAEFREGGVYDCHERETER
ncbi:hypothetical protein DFH08DRAFT_804579 [Mycena albidolilacea]|uniref:Uncharacterized protein n=1 Tax=Mycena albidolilacea TaxID=1033008 RepID=A0AAD7ADA4_9AGAR|nr:hypothetical protein DFH08DRAFT_804579 [Mycena albidolilacea]